MGQWRGLVDADKIDYEGSRHSMLVQSCLKCVNAELVLMLDNQNELAFQFRWFAYFDHGCACFPHTFAWSQKDHVL
jgi:hypothetical protein